MIRCPASGSRPVVSVSSTTWRIVASVTGLCSSAGAILPKVASKSTLAHAVRERLVETAIRERVGALVLGMPGVTAHPMPFDVVALGELGERLPQILVLHRLAIGRAPVACSPGARATR